MANYSFVGKPWAFVKKPEHWKVGKEITQGEIDLVWEAAAMCDEKLTDYCDNLKKTMQTFGDLELILYDDKKDYVSDRFSNIANMVEQYYTARMEWITDTLRNASNAFELYKKNNSEGCIEEEEKVYDVDDDGNEYLKVIYHWHTCSCTGKREAADCSLCK